MWLPLLFTFLLGYAVVAGVVFGQLSPPEPCRGEGRSRRYPKHYACVGPWDILWNTEFACRSCVDYRRAINRSMAWPLFLPLTVLLAVARYASRVSVRRNPPSHEDKIETPTREGEPR